MIHTDTNDMMDFKTSNTIVPHVLAYANKMNIPYQEEDDYIYINLTDDDLNNISESIPEDEDHWQHPILI